MTAHWDGRIEALAERLRSRGYRLTPQRLAVVEALLADGSHPSAADVSAKVRERHPMVSLATVYQTLDVLKELGEVLELDFGEGFSRYDARHPYPHPHAICARCGAVHDVHDASPIDIAAWASRATGFAIHGYRLDFYGLCPCCRGSDTSSAPEGS